MENALNLKSIKKKAKGLSLKEGLNAVVIVGLIGLFLGFFTLFNEKFAETVGENTSSEKIFNNLNNEFESQKENFWLLFPETLFVIGILVILFLWILIKKDKI